MHIEIVQAVEFLGRLLQPKLDQDLVTRFKEELSKLLKFRFEHHWDPQQPFKGNGYRALSNFNGTLDPILAQAAIEAEIEPIGIYTHLPRDFVLWIDPFSVSYRVGDHGNIMTLFEDRSRGRITLKLDPSSSSSTITTTTTTNSNASPQQIFNTQKNSNVNTYSPPMSHYVTSRAFTPIRISPPNSPEKNTTASKKDTVNGNSNEETKSLSKGLVMAN